MFDFMKKYVCNKTPTFHTCCLFSKLEVCKYSILGRTYFFIFLPRTDYRGSPDKKYYNIMIMLNSRRAVGPDDIPVEVWKCLGESALKFLTKLYNRTMESERMPEEWRDSVLIPIFKNKGDVQSCSNYRGIKLISHTMKLWERIVEKRLRSDLKFSNQQYGFMPGKSTTDALFALRVLMEKYREGQKELHCVFVDLEKAYDKVPREEVWYCMRKSGLAEKYVRIVQD